MTRKRKLALALVGGLAFVIASLTCYLGLSDLSGWGDTAARIASDTLGRELTIGGEFAVDAGRITRVTATDISLVNAAWGSEPLMASIDRLTLEIDLWSLVSGPLFLPTIDVEGAEALFESDPDGHSNWVFGSTTPEPDGAPVDLRIDHVRVVDLRLRSRGSAEDVPTELLVSSFQSDGDSDGMHQLSTDATLSDTPIRLSGRLGPLTGLINTSEVNLNLVGDFGSTEGRCRGTIRDLATLAGLDLEVSVTIPDADELTAFAGMPETDAGSFVINATASTESELTELTVAVTADAGTASVTGTIDSLLKPQDLALDLDVAGPSIRRIAALADIGNLPDDPFSATGHLRWRGFPIAVDDLVVEVGENRLAAGGSLGAPPLMLNTDFHFHGGGPNIASLAALGGLQLPADRFALDGKIVRVANGLRIDAVEASIGPTIFSTNGFVGDPPEYDGTDLAFRLGGPNLAHFSSAAGVDLPADAFDIEGRLADGGDAIALNGVRTRIGRNTLTLDGRVTTEPGMIGTDLTVVADGADLSNLGFAAGARQLPAAPFHVSGGVAFTRDGYQLRKIEGHIADLRLAVDGTISTEAGFSGSRMRIEAGGADLSKFASLVGSPPLPSEPFRVAGGIDVLRRGIGLRGVDIEMGSLKGSIDGFLGTGAELDGTELHIEARGPSLAIIRPAIPDIPLPEVAFDLRTDVASTDGQFRISEGTLVLDNNTVTVAGVVVPSNSLTGSTIDLSMEGHDFSSVGRLASAVLRQEWPPLPSLAYTISSSLGLETDTLRVDSLTATLGRARAELVGTIGRGPELSGTDLRLDIDGPDASLFQAVTGTEIPVAPFELTGGVAIADRRTSFDDVRLRIAGFRAQIDGTVGPPPALIGTEVTVDLDGPDLTLIGDLSGVDGLPALPFRLAGRFEGDPQRFTAIDVTAAFGSSDLSGGFRVDLEGKPAADCEFRSDRIDVAELREARAATGADSTDATPMTEEAATPFLFPDTTLDFSALETLDLRLDWEIGEMALRLNQYRNVGFTAHLDDGRLEVSRFDAVGANGGELRGTAILEPVARGYRIQTRSSLKEARINLTGEDADPSEFAPVDLNINLTAVGRTAHELASTTNGRIGVTVAEGVVGSSVVDLVAADILATLLEALNPFAKEDPETRLQCAVLVANFDDGVMTLDPTAIQTDKMTILGSGTIDFTTEELKLDWVTKPRKGIGLSASAITNPYIRLGGTLSKPALEMKPMEALATTGVAVATAGLSILGKGLLDRITAEKKVCEKAMQQVAEMEAGTSKK